MTANTKLVREAERVAENLGFQVLERAPGGKHIKLRLRTPAGSELWYTVPQGPRAANPRWPNELRTALRRLLR